MNRFISPPLLALATCALSLCSACVTYERATIDPPHRFDLLYERELSTFEQRLAAENQTDVDDAWTRLGEAWVALANCQPIADDAFADDPSPDPLARFLHASVKLEDARRRRLIYHRGTAFRRTSVRGYMFAALDDEDFFNRDPEELSDEYVVWPASEEAWVDELPGGISQPNKCVAMYKELFASAREERLAYNEREKRLKNKRRMRQIDLVEVLPPRSRLELLPEQFSARDAIEPDTLAHYQAVEITRLEQLIAYYEALDDRTRAMPSIEALAWRARFHLASLYNAFIVGLMNLRDPTPQELDLIAFWLERRAETFAALAARELAFPDEESALEALPEIAPTRRGQALIFYAEDLRAAGKLDEAHRAWSLAFSLGVDRTNYWTARYGHLRTLTQSERWEDAIAIAADLPPSNTRIFGPYAWHLGRALYKSGQTDAFIAHALSVFRDRPYQADPFTRALYIQMLDVLTSYPFDPRVIELVEDMGPRPKIFERMEEYAAVALDRGQAANAAAAARWLLAKHLNANYYPRYWAILALSSFLEDDLESFKAHLERVVARPADLVEAVGARRSATFFATADAQLARVLREMLPVMAEWGDGEQAMALRKKWLREIIAISQKFVRETPGSLARPALVELYRIASALLEADDPRAYPERVGQDGPAPLVLGTVRVIERDLDPYEPSLTIRFASIFSLTLIPRDRVPVASWQPWWIDVPEDPMLAPMIPRRAPEPEPQPDAPKEPS